MKQRKKELNAESAVLAAIDVMPEADRAIAKQLHAIIKTNAPALLPKLWYGMPAYANENGKIICFFQSKQRFKTRYATFGFMHEAKLDKGSMWPVAFAITKLTGAEETKIAALVKKAASNKK